MNHIVAARGLKRKNNTRVDCSDRRAVTYNYDDICITASDTNKSLGSYSFDDFQLIKQLQSKNIKFNLPPKTKEKVLQQLMQSQLNEEDEM